MNLPMSVAKDLINVDNAPVLRVYNAKAVKLAKNTKYHKLLDHIDVRYCFV